MFFLGFLSGCAFFFCLVKYGIPAMKWIIRQIEGGFN